MRNTRGHIVSQCFTSPDLTPGLQRFCSCSKAAMPSSTVLGSLSETSSSIVILICSSLIWYGCFCPCCVGVFIISKPNILPDVSWVVNTTKDNQRLSVLGGKINLTWWSCISITGLNLMTVCNPGIYCLTKAEISKKESHLKRRRNWLMIIAASVNIFLEVQKSYFDALR